jgi:putative ABC transport system permease protein
MSTAARLAWRDLSAFRGQAIAMGSVFAIAVAAFVTLGSYRASLLGDYAPSRGNLLIVQATQSFGEFYGSRISPQTATVLRALGVTDAVPEIHAVVGTSLQDAVLLKGIDLERYEQLDTFSLLAGRGLRPGDAPRQAMIGTRLAQRLAAAPGDTIRLRGREFQVVGIFETGSYSENEAWVPLKGAQDLLGWGDDVSLYVIPGDASLTPGDLPANAVSLARRGELWSTFPQQWEGLMTLIASVTQALGLAAALALAALLWRIAWRRRWQIAVLRSLGFGRSVFSVYLAVQGSLVVLFGGTVGILAALGLLYGVRPTLAGVTLNPHLTASVLVLTAFWLVALTVISLAVPVWVLGRRRVVDLMSSE